ncbi:(d)CMP kinase [Halofilum ochraceum]|uniref:(d)CMP kinase n=1 Tax=Halofilum ochraceum TaxID=1611323 RepID=UPI0008DAC81E|nr:(d)CMP kinase [Halofilum ochraceum]
MTERAGGGVPVVCIDGPSGSGKGTLARRVAEELGFYLLDSGALYRLTALAAVRRGVDLDDEAAVAEVAATMQPRFEPTGDGWTRTWLDGDHVTREIRAEEVGMNASRVAALPAVREALLALQRGFRQPPGLVADGRDMGSVVFPDAQLKIFLTASAEERARRRYKQLNDKGIGANLAALLNDIEARDEQDAQRAASPMVPADDAIVIDSTSLAIEEVTQQVLARARDCLQAE